MKFLLAWLVIVFLFDLYLLVNNTNKKQSYTPILFSPTNQEVNKKDQITPNPLTLEEIFDQNQTSVFSDKISLIATGDVMLGRSVNYRATVQNDFEWPFLHIADFLKNADITSINFEGTLINNCPLTNHGMKFCGNPQLIKGVTRAGVDIASLANNHSSNYGKQGLEQTVGFLTQAGISPAGLNKSVFKKVKNTTVSFLAYNLVYPDTPEISWASDEKVKKEITDTKSKSDILIVSFHWGNEYTHKPSQQQKHFARLAVDSGADVVIGHHPHWIQPIEVYKQKPIFYSLGNFIFDQMWSQKTKEGLAVKLIFYKNQPVDVLLYPLEIKNYGQPFLVTGEKEDYIIESLYNLSVNLE